MAIGDKNPVQTLSKKSTGGLSGFRLNQDEEVYRLILSIQGLEKTGKNHLAFSAPGDIAIQSFDIGLEGVVQKFNKQKRIYAAEYQLEAQPGVAQKEAIQEEAEKLWNKFIADYLDALHTASVKTVIHDTGTEVWELLRLANWGALSANSQHYSKINPIFRRVVREAYDCNKNLIMIHKMKDQWAAGLDGKQRPTGKLERSGMKEVGYLVQAVIQTWRDPGDNTFHATMLDCRQNPEVNNFDFASGSAFEPDFPTIAQMVFPNSTEEHWK